jgi:ankyrin repeat protein
MKIKIFYFTLLSLLFIGCQSTIARMDAEEINRAIKQGKSLDVVDEDGGTFLTFSSAFHHDENVKLLLRNGANVNAKDGDGSTALHSALFLKSKPLKVLNTTKLLVSHGAKLNVKDQYGDTPLHVACSLSRNKDILEIVQYLVSKGANMRIKNNDGESAWAVCQENPGVYAYYKGKF